MKFFADTASVKKIAELKTINLVNGVTTNPSLILKEGKDFHKIAREICSLVSGPVSLEVSSTSIKEMRVEANKLIQISDNVVVILPLTWDGLKLCRELSDKGIKVNMTLCFTLNQALLAAKAGSHFVSPFVGRLDDSNIDGIELIKKIRITYDNYQFNTKILAASIRSQEHIERCALVGADAITAPPEILHVMADHPLTKKGLAKFLEDWAKSNQKI